MKSPKVELLKKQGLLDPSEEYSDMQICKSPAGYFIGTIYSNPEGYTEPGSRDSHYFLDEASAQLYLEQVESAENPIPLLRMNP